MTEKNRESPQDPRKRFKDLLDKVEQSEEEAQKLAKQMEDHEEGGGETRTGDQEAGHEDKDMTASSPPGESLSRPGEHPAVKGEEPSEGVRENPPAADQDTADEMQEDGEPGHQQAPAGSEEIRDPEPGIQEEVPSPKGEYEGLSEEDNHPGEQNPSNQEAGDPALDRGSEGAVEEEDPSLRKTIYFGETPSKPPSWVESPGVKEQESLNGAEDEFPEQPHPAGRD